MNDFKRNALSIVALWCAFQLAQAATVRVDQTWEERGFVTNGLQFTTTAVFSDAAIGGLGVENVLVGYFGMARYRFGIGQNFFLANFPDPPGFTEGNMLARYVDGEFQYLSHVDQGGSARIALIDGNTGGAAGGLNIAGSELIWHIPVSGNEYYNLVSTALTVSNVPIPSVLVLFVTGLLATLLKGVGKKAGKGRANPLTKLFRPFLPAAVTPAR